MNGDTHSVPLLAPPSTQSSTPLFREAPKSVRVGSLMLFMEIGQKRKKPVPAVSIVIDPRGPVGAIGPTGSVGVIGPLVLLVP